MNKEGSNRRKQDQEDPYTVGGAFARGLDGPSQPDKTTPIVSGILYVLTCLVLLIMLGIVLRMYYEAFLLGWDLIDWTWLDRFKWGRVG